MDADTQKMRAVVSPGEGDLVISEVMAAPAAVSETDGEWFELYARKDVDLNGLLVRAGNSKPILSSTSCIRALANTYLLFARNGDSAMNGGLPPLTAESSVSLPDNASSRSIANGNAVIDQIAWTSTKKGVAWQISPSALDASPEERARASCLAVTSYGKGDKGTPGSQNAECARSSVASGGGSADGGSDGGSIDDRDSLDDGASVDAAARVTAVLPALRTWLVPVLSRARRWAVPVANCRAYSGEGSQLSGTLEPCWCSK
jgi:hypothetical protein